MRLLIVDDRAVVREELRSTLELFGNVRVVGEATDGWDALRQAQALKPDIVLMDLEMPGLDGFETTRRLKAMRLAQIVVVLTVHEDSFSRQKAAQAGADAFIVKGTELRAIVDVFEQLSQR